jgi:hypothetical protein
MQLEPCHTPSLNEQGKSKRGFAIQQLAFFFMNPGQGKLIIDHAFSLPRGRPF